MSCRTRVAVRAACVGLVLGSVACGRGRSAPPSPALDASTSPPRSPEVIRRDGNHLMGEGSVYLAQHSHNPVDWYPWSSEALERARAQDKPIFLSIGYSSCHWCHVMQAEVFEQDDVAAFLNAHFVSIKVDREERPDLDETYMQALLSMTGSGGWPMSLFLTPARTPFFGATYLPHERFLGAARRAAEQFATARAEVESSAEQVRRRIDRAADGPISEAGSPLDAGALHAMAVAALDRVDPQWGGFRGSTKFPTPVRWAFLLHAARKWGDPALEAAVRGTLDAMAAGGIRDPIGGGFHRYSTDARWETPHFEKMLYDNAQLATLYVEAGVALHEPRYVSVATDTLDFLLREMRSDGGGFYASLDADSSGREGAYYVWTRDALVRSLGAEDGDLAARLVLPSTTGRGPIDGAWAPNRRASFDDVATQIHGSASDVERRWLAIRSRLAAARDRRPRPRLDTKVVTAWNGLVLTALAHAFDATDDARYLDAADRCADGLWRAHRSSPDGLVRDTNEGRHGAAGVLSDYAFLAQGLLAVFEVTGRRELLEHAITLVTEADTRFGAGDRGGWYDAEAGATPFGRTISLDDSVEPSGSAVLLSDRIALGALTLRPELTHAVDASLRARAGELRGAGMESAGWLDAALLRVGPYYDLVVAGVDASAVARLYTVRQSLDPGWVASARVPASGPAAAFEGLLAAARGKTAIGTPSKAYVCLDGACKAPTSDPVILRAQLLAGWKL